MKFRNFLSLFLCLTMIFAVGQSMVISSSAHEYRSCKVSSCDKIMSDEPISLSSVQKTAFSWKKFAIVCVTSLLFVASTVACLAASSMNNAAVEEKEETNINVIEEVNESVQTPENVQFPFDTQIGAPEQDSNHQFGEEMSENERTPEPHSYTKETCEDVLAIDALSNDEESQLDNYIHSGYCEESEDQAEENNSGDSIYENEVESEYSEATENESSANERNGEASELNIGIPVIVTQLLQSEQGDEIIPSELNDDLASKYEDEIDLVNSCANAILMLIGFMVTIFGLNLI